MDKYLITTKLRKYFKKTKDKVLTISNIRRHFGSYEFSDNLPIFIPLNSKGKTNSKENPINAIG